MNKAILQNYLQTEPNDAKEKYIFLIDDKNAALAIISAGFKAAALIKEEGFFAVEEFISYLKEKSFSGTCMSEYIYVTACNTKKANDRLKEYFKMERLQFKEDGWKLFRQKEYLFKLEPASEQELKTILDNFVRRYEGNDVENSVKETVRNDSFKSEAKPIDLMQFHLVGDSGKIIGVYHNAIFEYIKANYDLFVVGGTPYIYDYGYYKADTTGARLKTLIRGLILPQFIKSITINNIYALFLQDANLETEFNELNCYPSYWICFKNGMWDCKEKRMLPHSPKYKAINQIPHEYHPEKKQDGEKIEEYLNFICDGKLDTREMLLQFMGYSLAKDTGQQKFLILLGEGGSGKSTLIKCFEMLVGQRNISNVSLTDLQERFSSVELMGMLVNSCADFGDWGINRYKCD